MVVGWGEGIFKQNYRGLWICAEQLQRYLRHCCLWQTENHIYSFSGVREEHLISHVLFVCLWSLLHDILALQGFFPSGRAYICMSTHVNTGVHSCLYILYAQGHFETDMLVGVHESPTAALNTCGKWSFRERARCRKQWNKQCYSILRIDHYTTSTLYNTYKYLIFWAYAKLSALFECTDSMISLGVVGS